MTYEEYEKLCKQQRDRNEEFLDVFEKDLIQAGLTQKTISRHLHNVYFYINTYILREEPLGMEEGCGFRIDDYFGYFFIRKCMWSTPGNIKTTAASIKKFYRSMENHGYIPGFDYEYLCCVIKDNMVIWQKDCRVYNR